MAQELSIQTLRTALKVLPLGGIRFFQTIGSTNDQAINWALENAPDLSLVVADEQTSGRGRNGRKWYSPAGGALAFSLILRMKKNEAQSIGLFSALGALAVCQAINEMDVALVPKIKWPNDVLVNDQKVCGILTEATWIGNTIESLIIGIGVNISQASVPPKETINFPATFLEDLTYRKIDKIDLLLKILIAMLVCREQIGTSSFVKLWQEKLAFQGEVVAIYSENSEPRTGIITGLESDGGLCLKDANGQEFTCHFGEVHLRPLRL